MFGFQEAIALWDGNTRAATGLAEARLAYAECAKAKGDYELGLSLLDSDSAEHAVLRVELASMQRERDMRQKWLTRFKRIAAAMAILVFGVISASLLVVAQAKNRETDAKNQAIKDKEAAEIAEREAESARQKELEQKNIAVAAEAKARQEEAAARAAERKAKTAEEEERKQKLIAVEAEAKAKAEEQKAVAAKRGEEYAAYLARIGVAAAKIDENAYDAADSLLAACLPEDGSEDLRNWEWGYLKRLGRQGFDFHGQGTTTSAAFAPDGQWFTTVGDDGIAHLWDPENGRERLAIKHGAAIHSVAVSPDGQTLATAGADGKVRLFKSADGTAVHTLSGHEDRVLGAAFSPQDGRWLATCSRDRTVRVWDVATGREAPGSPLRGHSWWVWSVAFSADQKQLVSAGQDGKVLVWSFGDAAGGGPIARQEKVFLGHEGPVFAAAFSPDGSQVASAGYDKRVLVWQPDKIDQVDLEVLVSKDPLRPQPSRSFEGHSAPVRTVAYSADGQSIASGGDDNIVRVWDAATGKPTAVLRGHSRPVETCAFRRTASGSCRARRKVRSSCGTCSIIAKCAPYKVGFWPVMKMKSCRRHSRPTANES